MRNSKRPITSPRARKNQGKQSKSTQAGEPVYQQDVLLLLRSLLPSLSKVERRICDFILESPSDTSLLRLEQISDRCGTSAASVSRFVNRLGFKDFKTFQISLARHTPPLEETRDDILFSDEPPEEVISKVFQINQRGLTETLAIVDPAVLIETAQRIAKCRRVVLIGLGGSGVIAQDGEIRLAHLGILANAYSDPYQMVVAASALTSEDVLIAISHTGQSRAVVANVQLAQAHKAFAVGITNYVSSPLALACDRVLLSSYCERMIHAAKTSSHIAQLCLLDCVYFLVAQILDDKCKTDVMRLENAISREIR